jgi:alpha/beta superfamily hydrolase
MSEQELAAGRVFFSGDYRLEGVLEWPPSVQSGADGVGRSLKGGVVVAHPHPLYGGTLAQPVVFRVAKACRERGFATLRFNFRGVGASGGAYDGREEYRDVEAALAYLEGRLRTEEAPGGSPEVPTTPAVPRLALVGYSFGSIMAAVAAGRGRTRVAALALVAFAVTWPELPPDLFSTLKDFKGPVLAVCGELDDLAPPDEVAAVLGQLGLDFRVEVVTGAGHLFEGRQQQVGEMVAAFLEAVFRHLPDVA